VAALPPLPRWDLHATVDPSLRREDDPMPHDTRERVFPLDMADHLIGRRSDSADIHPEIVINDPGISRRHARILRAPDGALTLVDLGSMNGTRLNDLPVEPNVVTKLSAGDQITIGCWTRLRVAPR
jgi:pSer/pThr/pTyr-binding forkhead associated (FHA) protein